MALGPERSIPRSPEDARQLPLEGFESLVYGGRVPGRLRFVAAAKILFEALRHPKGSTLILDGHANEVRVVHWNNPREQVREQTRLYKPI